MGDQRWWGITWSGRYLFGDGYRYGESDMALVVMGLSVGRQRPAAERGVKKVGFCWGGMGKQQRPVP